MGDADRASQIGEAHRTAAIHLEKDLRAGGRYSLVAESLVEGADECLTGAAERVGKFDGLLTGIGVAG
ncbi:hypothetical protein MHEL_39170 [Mycolicibacterium helvum]|uniref:Uncharacterized protein n=1 Tax=Mycolicibacterium helvum TaxID=1534349 RepID=A0A7I7T8U2_9MYCO|nr:hypothetical protein MHEL_39170 [Mycolicibacterium helvum]